MIKKYNLKNKKHAVDFFIADEIEMSSFRNEITSMENPFFALKGGDTKIREYKNGKITITIRPASGIGLATIFDKDIWIYAISKLQEAINNNQPISRTIIFTPYNFFITTNRNTSGRSYFELERALLRLSGTLIKTNIIYSKNNQETMIFGLIERAKILEEKKGKLNIGMVEITLPDWLYKAVKNTKVLKINPDYFRIRKAIDRRLYEIARKHCGNQYEFTIALNKLYLKSGSSSLLKEFKRKIKALIITNDLPDYTINYNIKNDNIIFTNRKQIKLLNKKKIKNNLISIKKFFLYSNKKIPEGFK